MTQAKTNAELQRRFERYERTQLPQLTASTIRSINDQSRLQVLDILTEYATKDNVISKARINTLLRELEAVEKDVRAKAEAQLRSTFRTTAQQASYNANQSVLSTSATALAPLIGVPVAALVAQAGKPLVDVIGETALAFGKTFATIVKNVLEYIFRRRDPNDKKTLLDRIWQYAGVLRDKLASVIRNEALKGKTVDEIMRKVKDVYKGEEWKLRRLVQTEALTTYRAAVAEAAKRSKTVKALKIVDHPNGHANHDDHECYIYARANEHGLGRGIYPVTETKILLPHPQCTATLHFVLADELERNGGDANA